MGYLTNKFNVGIFKKILLEVTLLSVSAKEKALWDIAKLSIIQKPKLTFGGVRNWNISKNALNVSYSVYAEKTDLNLRSYTYSKKIRRKNGK